MGDETWGGVGSCWGACVEDLSALLLFSSEFGAPVSVPVQEILDVICRTLSISAKNIVSAAGARFAAWPRPRAAGGQRGRQAPAALSPRGCPGQPLPSVRMPALPVLVPTQAPIGRVCSRFSERVQQRLPRGRVNLGSAGSLQRGSAVLPVILSPGSGLEDDVGLVGPAGHGDGSFLCTGVSGSLCLRASLSSPAPHSCRVSCRACLETVPCGCCFCLPSTWMPWTCSPRSSSREWEGAGCSEGTSMCWDRRSPFCPHPQVWRPSLALWGPHQPPASPGPQCLEPW